VVQEGVIVLDVVGGLVGLSVLLEEVVQSELLVGVSGALVFLVYLNFNSKVLLYLELNLVIKI
jgi:hypothetical protein